MKKGLSLFFILILSLCAVSCNGIIPDFNIGNGTENDEFDTNKVTLTSAYAKAQDLGFEGTLDEFIELISGKDGVDGKDGIDGKDGVGITSVLIDNNGDLLVILSDGNTVNCGKVKGADGKDGVNGTNGADGKTPYIEDGYWYIDGTNTGVKAEGTNGITPTIEVNDEGFWVINGVETVYKAVAVNGESYIVEISSDGYWVINGVKTEHKAVGADGSNGKDGIDGINGTNGADGKTPTFKLENGELKVSYDNGSTWSSLGYIQGKDGANGTNGTNGTDGTNGIDGEKGDTGIGIEKVELDDDGNLLITYTDGTTQTVVLPADSEIHKHIYGEWVSYGGSTEMLFTVCKTCKEIVWKFGTCTTHTFTTTTVAPTCTTEGYDHNICSVCDYEEKVNYTDIIAHDYDTEYSRNNSFHWYKCKSCDAITSKAEHNIGDDGFCTACYQPLAPTEGILYELSTDGTYAEVVGYTGTATKIIIADTYNGVPVTNICEKVFQNNTTITSVVIPDSVTNIGAYAFQYCSGLSSITIPDSVTNIGAYAFDNCRNLANVLIPNSVTKIGGYAFSYCSKLSSITIPENVTSMGDDAFGHCGNLNKIQFNAISTTCGNYVFRSAGHNTQNMKVIIGKNVTQLPYRLFYGGAVSSSDAYSPDIVSVEFEEGSICTSIGDYAFYGCSTLVSITIPDSVTYVGSYAFDGCSSILFTEYEFGKYLGNTENPYAILYQISNKNLSTYTINENSKIIANSAFSSSSRLTSIIIPDNVTGIGSSAFYSCGSLTSVTIGNGVTSIGSSAFSNCASLTNITIPNSVMIIGDNAFSGCSNLASITIGNSVTYIGAFAFNGCIHLMNITIPDSVTNIGDNAFSGCTSLTSVIIGNGITSISGLALGALTNLTSVTIGNSVTSIGYREFSGCSALISVIVGNNISSIEDYAFYRCSNLTNIVIPDKVTSIGEYAFADCTSLTNITIPNSVISIGSNAFNGCSKVETIQFNAIALIDLGTEIFSYTGCSNGIKLTIGKNVTEIPAYLFYSQMSNAAKITSIEFEENSKCEHIGKYAFARCKSLLKVTLGTSVTTIDNYAFYYCDSLISITLSDNIAVIGDYAFGNCFDISTVNYYGDENRWNSISLSKTWISVDGSFWPPNYRIVYNYTNEETID